MSELFFPSHTLIVKRQRRIGSSNRFSVSATYSAIPADIQPASRERVEFFGGRFGATFTAFLDTGVDIKENDQVVDASGKKYSVKGLQRWQGAGLLDHLEVVLVAQDS